MRDFFVGLGTITLIVFAALALTFVLATTCVDVANAKETTTLDDALERPVKVERSYDMSTGVACYWNTRYPKYLSCVQIHEIGIRQLRGLRNEARD